MKVNIKKTEIVQSVDDLPNGKYGALWSGYRVKIELDNGTVYVLDTNEGVRGMNIPCIITKTDEGYEIEVV